MRVAYDLTTLALVDELCYCLVVGDRRTSYARTGLCPHAPTTRTLGTCPPTTDSMGSGEAQSGKVTQCALARRAKIDVPTILSSTMDSTISLMALPWYSIASRCSRQVLQKLDKTVSP